MSEQTSPVHYLIGWDVGGWNCDNNPTSRDALVILDAERNLIGTPWRGNLRTSINAASTARDWLRALFAYCRADFPGHSLQVVLAIDTPLAFSETFIRLITHKDYAEPIGSSETNPYLFRATERFLFEHGLKQLSPIKDMLGSQATKGMHVLRKYVPKAMQCGVWSDGKCLSAIEAYPSACKHSTFIQDLLARYGADEQCNPTEKHPIESFDHQDKRDALTCALLAHAFAFRPNDLVSPPDFMPVNEGWIWVPKDALSPIIA